MILRIPGRELSELLTHLECLFVASILLIESHQFLAAPRVGRIKLCRPQPMLLGRLPPAALVIQYAGIRVGFRRTMARLDQQALVQNVVPLLRGQTITLTRRSRQYRRTRPPSERAPRQVSLKQ